MVLKNRKLFSKSTNKTLLLSLITISAIFVGMVGANILGNSRAAITWPAVPPVLVCGNQSILSGPSTPPSGAITVPAGDNSNINLEIAGATYWFAPGVHTLGTGIYSQITPGNNSTYIGAPGAIIDGQKVNRYAFTQHATNVTIKYLTIRNFGDGLGDNNNEGVVNHDGGNDWTISYNTITENGGAGVFIGDGNVISYNCLTKNEQYGFSAYEPDGVVNVTMDHNEISYNNTYDWESKIDGCGCTGGGKFWETSGAVITNNYIHHNYSVGLWADGDNSDFIISGNYISDNDAEGIFYEQSYNAVISNNNIIHNAVVKGPTNPGFPAGGIYISEAGGDTRAPGGRSTLEISGNNIENNWSGIILWENADRFCGSPANTSTGMCTLVNPSVVNVDTCNATNINKAPYYNDCRWKTQNVQVFNNTLKHVQGNVGNGCSLNTGCGYNGIFSNWGTYPSWSPYMGRTVQDNITYNQNNKFYNNTYIGSWMFLPWETGNEKTFAQWQASPYFQDSGSTMNSTPPVTDTTPPTVSLTSPTAGSTVSGTINMTANASDDSGTVSKVEFYVDNVLKGTDTATPWTYSLNTTTLTNATHSFTAKAFDAANNSTTSSAISATINNTSAYLAEDINQDGKVNLLDFSLLASKYGQTGTVTTLGRSDINQDGKVNLLDFSLLASKYGYGV